jgi:putative endonuclease
MWHVYIALLQGGAYYVGMTRFAPGRRMKDHLAGRGEGFTRAHPVRAILWSERHASSDSARKRERQIKRWTRAKKEAMIRGDMARLKALARSRSS